MSKTIWKFQMDIVETQLVRMPAKAEILSVQVQDGIPCLWALVNPANGEQDKCIEMFGTGHPVNCDMGVSRTYIGTFQMNNTGLVFHAFERH